MTFSLLSNLYSLLSFRPGATILPQLLLRLLPQQLRSFVAENWPFSPFCRSCQVHCDCNNQMRLLHCGGFSAHLPPPSLPRRQTGVFVAAIRRCFLAFTRNCLPPTLWRNCRPSAPKHLFPPQNRHTAPRVVAVVRHSASAAAAAATTKNQIFWNCACI
jgi:hypothetical protein